jgi:hypothetical protein
MWITLYWHRHKKYCNIQLRRNKTVNQNYNDWKIMKEKDEDHRMDKISDTRYIQNQTAIGILFTAKEFVVSLIEILLEFAMFQKSRGYIE